MITKLLIILMHIACYTIIFLNHGVFSNCSQVANTSLYKFSSIANFDVVMS